MQGRGHGQGESSLSTNAVSLAGTPAASPLGYFSWTFGQAARDPYYIMVIIYIFYPYFSNTVVGDPVKGQALIGYITATAGQNLGWTSSPAHVGAPQVSPPPVILEKNASR